MINCIVIDDEQPAINILADYIKEVPFLKLEASTINPLAGLALANESKPGLVFLDIQMQGITGLEFAKLLNPKTKIIFTTAYDKFALNGFELNAVDYLLKPIPFPRFLQAAQKAKAIIEQNEIVENNFHHDFLVVQGDQKGKLIKIEIADIDYIESIRNYVSIVCGDKKIISLMSMKDLEDYLPSNKFIRVHRSYILPLGNIASINGNHISLKRNAKTDIIVGTSYKDAFLEIMRSRMIN